MYAAKVCSMKTHNNESNALNVSMDVVNVCEFLAFKMEGCVPFMNRSVAMN